MDETFHTKRSPKMSSFVFTSVRCVQRTLPSFLTFVSHKTLGRTEVKEAQKGSTNKAVWFRYLF